jgi:hypothetical protein
MDAAVVDATSKLSWKFDKATKQYTLDGAAFVAVAAYKFCKESHTHVRAGFDDLTLWYVGRLTWRSRRNTGGGVQWYEADKDDATLYHKVTEGEVEGRFAWSAAAKTPLFPLRDVVDVVMKDDDDDAEDGFCRVRLKASVDVLAQAFVREAAAAATAASSALMRVVTVDEMMKKKSLQPPSKLRILAEVGMAMLPASTTTPGMKFDVVGKKACVAKMAVNRSIKCIMEAMKGRWRNGTGTGGAESSTDLPGPRTAVVLDTRFLSTTRAVNAHTTWAPNMDVTEADAMQEAARTYRVLPADRVAWAAAVSAPPRVRVVPVTLGIFLERYAQSAATMPTKFPPLDVVCADYTSAWATYAATDMTALATLPNVLADVAVVTVTACVRGDRSGRKHVINLVKAGLGAKLQGLSPAAASVVGFFITVFETAGRTVELQTVMQYNCGTMVFIAATVCRGK